MNEVTILHNPRCSKSRQALDLLQQHGIAPQIIEYLQTPPNAAELERILSMLAMEPRDLMRREEPEYLQQQLDNPTFSREQLIAAMQAHPKLIQRPIVISGNKAIIGRPPENVLTIL
jgi:arsenate reductase